MKKPIFNIQTKFNSNNIDTVKTNSLPSDPVAESLVVQQRINTLSAQLQNLSSWCGTVTANLATQNTKVSQFNTTRENILSSLDRQQNKLLDIDNNIYKQQQKIQNLILRKAKLEQVKIKVAESNNTTKLENINSAITNIGKRISKTTETIIPKLQVRSHKISDRVVKINTKLENIDKKFTKQSTRSTKTLNNLNKAVVKTLVHTEALDRLQNKLRVINTQIDSTECLCPSVYNPVNMRGTVYSNECIARCKLGIGNAPEPLLPIPNTKPSLPNGDDRICAQVITCGSDGNTYPDSCLPKDVFAVGYGKSCNELGVPVVPGYKPPNSWSASLNPSKPFKEALLPINAQNNQAANISKFSDPDTRLVFGYVPLESCCGTDNITYPLSELPSGIGIKHIGPCNSTSRYEISDVIVDEDTNGGVRLSVNFKGSLTNSFPNKDPNDTIYAILSIAPSNKLFTKGSAPVALNWLNPNDINAPAGVNLSTDLIKNSLYYFNKNPKDNIAPSSSIITHAICHYDDCIERNIVPLRKGVAYRIELFVYRDTGRNSSIDKNRLSYSSETIVIL